MAKISKAPGRPKGLKKVSVVDTITFDKESNFREDSMRGVIFATLKAQRPNYNNLRALVNAVCAKLEPKIGKEPFTFKRHTGLPSDDDYKKRMLRFSVNRTIFDYAMFTNQHNTNTK